MSRIHAQNPAYAGLTHFEVTALEATSGSRHGTHFASALEAATVIIFESLTSGNDDSFLISFLDKLKKNTTNSLLARARRGSTSDACYS